MELNGQPPVSGFCRDCLTRLESRKCRCPQCGSPRLLYHRQLHQLAIAHLDCDAFYAAVEKRDTPDLRDKPVIIGGGRRGVVATACYLARLRGVHSAMPMFQARKACPDAVVIAPDMNKYTAVSRLIRTLMLEYTPLVEPVSIDEAFLDLSGTEELHGMSPAMTMARMALRMEKEIGITVSIGLSGNKFLAKLSSDMNKPRGFSVLAPSEAAAFLNDRPVSLIWGVGKALRRKLARNGLTTIGQIRQCELKNLVNTYGVMGERLYRFSRGMDSRSVTPESTIKSISKETTFTVDLSDRHELEAILWRQCDDVAARCRARGMAGRTATLKLKTAGFRQITRSKTLLRSSQLAETLFRTLQPLLAREARGTPFRLIGAGYSNLEPCSHDRTAPASLLDSEPGSHIELERAMDRLRRRFGSKAITRGHRTGDDPGHQN